jgi:hypothetical protein
VKHLQKAKTLEQTEYNNPYQLEDEEDEVREGEAANGVE